MVFCNRDRGLGGFISEVLRVRWEYIGTFYSALGLSLRPFGWLRAGKPGIGVTLGAFTCFMRSGGSQEVTEGLELRIVG